MLKGNETAKFFKIMSCGCLDLLECRLSELCALLRTIVSSSATDEISAGSVSAAAELLDYILSDFQTDVDGSADYTKGGAEE